MLSAMGSALLWARWRYEIPREHISGELKHGTIGENALFYRCRGLCQKRNGSLVGSGLGQLIDPCQFRWPSVTLKGKTRGTHFPAHFRTYTRTIRPRANNFGMAHIWGSEQRWQKLTAMLTRDLFAVFVLFVLVCSTMRQLRDVGWLQATRTQRWRCTLAVWFMYWTADRQHGSTACSLCQTSHTSTTRSFGTSLSATNWP